MNRMYLKAFVLFLMAGAMSLVWGHHGSRISYDMTKTVTVTGIVKEFKYQNPHVYFTFDVKDEKGEVTTWGAETDSPIVMERRYQWNRHFLAPGDEVTVTLWKSKVDAPRGFMAKLVRPDGSITDHSGQLPQE
jgi:hypothetical protein